MSKRNLKIVYVFFIWTLQNLEYIIYLSHISKEKKVLVTQSCLTLCSPMDCSLPGSSVHGILQARVLEWVASPFSRGPSRPKDRTCISCIGRFFTIWATREALHISNWLLNFTRNTWFCVYKICSWKSIFTYSSFIKMYLRIFQELNWIQFFCT